MESRVKVTGAMGVQRGWLVVGRQRVSVLEPWDASWWGLGC
jgi:hypothetical protein